MSSGDFIQARARLADKDRSVRDKQMELHEAIHHVRDGDRIAVGGCLYSRTPTASLMEILRQGRTGLTLARSLTCYEAELFLARGAAERIVTSWVGIGLLWGLPKVFRHFIEGGLATYEEWSHLSIGLRFKAAAMGLPFLPTKSMLGSDLLPMTEAKEMTCPFTGERLALVPAYHPDVALIHVQRADRFGNAQIEGPPYMDKDIAIAAQTVILTAEEIVEPEIISAHPDRTSIAHFTVDAVVGVPFGSFPHECYGAYEADFDHFQDYVDLVDEKGVDGAREYVAKFVDEAGSFAGFLEQIGSDRLGRQQRRAEELMPR
jgi:glutaconate CoA-transferase, subunit A